MGDTIYTDGGGRDDQGLSRLGVIRTHKNRKSDDINDVISLTLHIKMTNNEAEYLAILYGCIMAGNGDTIKVDSELIAKQLSGEYRVKSQNLLSLYESVKKMCTVKKLKVEWVPREDNLAGIMLENNLKSGQ